MARDVHSLRSVRSEDGTAIAFERAGNGPPVILVGGALSSGFVTSRRSWSSLASWSPASPSIGSIAGDAEIVLIPSLMPSSAKCGTSPR
jgi:hypothetical protein